MNSFNIIQWILNGFFKKRDELKLIINNHNFQIICLQETNFKENYTAPLKITQVIAKIEKTQIGLAAEQLSM